MQLSTHDIRDTVLNKRKYISIEWEGHYSYRGTNIEWEQITIFRKDQTAVNVFKN